MFSAENLTIKLIKDTREKAAPSFHGKDFDQKLRESDNFRDKTIIIIIKKTAEREREKKRES